MSKSRKELKRNYRRYCVRAMGRRIPGFIDRNHARYMGYIFPMSFREWVKAYCP